MIIKYYIYITTGTDNFRPTTFSGFDVNNITMHLGTAFIVIIRSVSNLISSILIYR